MEKRPTYEELQQRLNRLEKELKKETLERGRAEEMLRKGEEKLRTVIEHSNEIFYIHDIRHVLSYVSPASEEILGYTPGKAMKKWTDLATDNPINLKGIEITEKAISTGERQGPYHLELRKKDGTIVLLEIDESPIKDEKGRVVGIAGAARDVTERTRAEEALHEQAQILASIKDTIVIITPEMKTIYANQTTKDLFGDRPEMFTEPCYRFYKKRETACENCPVIRAFNDKRQHQAIMKSYDKNGKEMWRFNTAFPFYDRDGRLIAAIEVVTDYTPQKMAELALRESEEKYRNLVEDSFDGIFIQKGTRIIFANRRLNEMLGYEEGELIGLDHWMVYHPDYQGLTRERAQARMRGEDVMRRYEVKMQRKDGSRFYGEVNARPITFPSDGEAGIQVWVRDIMDQKLKEETLRESEEKYRSLVQSTQDSIYLVDKECRYLFMNRKHLSRLGMPEDRVIGRIYRELHSEDDSKEFFGKVEEVFATGETIQHEHMSRRDGKHFLRTLSPVKGPEGKIGAVTVVSKDITRRVEAEEALKVSEEKYRNIFNNAQVGLFRTRISDGKALECNDRFANIHGYENRQECIGEFVGSKHYVDPGTRERMVAQIQKKGEISDFEARFYRKDGQIVWIRSSVRAYPDKGYLEGIEIDITEAKNAEEALIESEEKYRSIFEQSRDAIVITSVRGEFIDANRSGLELFGYTRDEMTKINFQRLYVDPNEGHRFRKEMNERGFVGDFETRLRKKDGTVMDCVFSVVLQRAREGDISRYQGVIRDITDQKRLQAQLQHAQTMEAIATLAGGIAHQFNNALTSITGYAGLLEMDFLKNEKVMKYVQAMKTSAHRMAHLTGQLLAYARGGKYNPQTLSLTDFIEDTLPLIQHTIKPDIRVETDLPVETWSVEADRTQMQMVLSAIVTNSNEAIEGPGRIRVSTRNLELDQRQQRQLNGHPGARPVPYVCLSIQDDGKGMDEVTKSRIFEPFFTTHFIGRGLGMASVYGIINNHGGWIEVDSEPEKGTEVRIYLPAVEPEAEEGTVPGAGIELSEGQGIVLVIEDEEDVMTITREALERLGYRVLGAKTGREAVEIARTFGGNIDLALLDIKLPDMSGGKVYPLIMEARPKLRVILCSGYAIDGPAQQILDAGAEGFIQKPFLVSTLGEKLKEVLGLGGK